MHAVLTQKEQACIDSIIHHHNLQTYPSSIHRYTEAKKDLVKSQMIGLFPVDCSSYDAALRQFCTAFGV